MALVIDPWIGSQAGRPDASIELDWGRAPFRLLAIVGRVDLARIGPDGVASAGEGRFIFGVLDPSGNAMPFTVILEYSLQATNLGQVRDWAKAWHNLGALGDFDEAYLAALQRITDAFAGRGIAPGRMNGNALNQLRTDEIALSSSWELREFALSPVNRLLAPVTVKVTPAIAFNHSATLASFITDSNTSILATNHSVPLDFRGSPFRAASATNDQPTWSAAGFESGKARFLFALATCNGCHGSETALPRFTHIDARNAGQVATLSAFLTDAGATIADPEDSRRTVQFSDLVARKEILSRLADIDVTDRVRAMPDLLGLLRSRQNRVH